MNGLWRGLADSVAGLHYLYIAYLLAGGFIAWRWPKTIYLHVAAAIWAALIVSTKVPCPLTALQNHFRESAGQRPLGDSFINSYIRGTFYPAGSQTLAQLLTAGVVVGSWIGFAIHQRSRRLHIELTHPLG